MQKWLKKKELPQNIGMDGNKANFKVGQSTKKEKEDMRTIRLEF